MEGQTSPETYGERQRTGGMLRVIALASLALLLLPLFTALQSHPPLVVVLGTLGLLTASIGLYVWLLFQVIPPQVSSASLHTKGALCALATLAITMNLAFPDDLRWGLLFYYVAVAAGFTFPFRRGLLAVGGSVMLALATLLVMHSTFSADVQQHLVQVVVNGVVEILLLGGGAVGARHLMETTEALHRAREELARLAVEEERHRFARDLHDLLGQSLSLIAVKSELIRRLLPEHSERATDQAREIEQVARRVLQEIREAVRGYRQPTLATEVAGARVALSAANIALCVEKSMGLLPARIEAVLSWAVREGVTNVLRHSQAQHCTLRLLQTEEAAWVEVSDDGVGKAPRLAGTGLAGLRERVASLGGAVEADTRPEGGFRLRVRLPLAGEPSFPRHS
jgi:two-component system sensor histidine kinase DesK